MNMDRFVPDSFKSLVLPIMHSIYPVIHRAAKHIEANIGTYLFLLQNELGQVKNKSEFL